MKLLKEILSEFSLLVLEKFDETQSIKIIVENRNKKKIKFKRFREYEK